MAANNSTTSFLHWLYLTGSATSVTFPASPVTVVTRSEINGKSAGIDTEDISETHLRTIKGDKITELPRSQLTSEQVPWTSPGLSSHERDLGEHVSLSIEYVEIIGLKTMNPPREGTFASKWQARIEKANWIMIENHFCDSFDGAHCQRSTGWETGNQCRAINH